jgi:hypothetical protein
MPQCSACSKLDVLALVQVLNVKLALHLSDEDLELLIDKYIGADYGDLVNYVAFAARISPAEAPYDPYTLGL